jgi:hypothetical protein
MMSYCTVAFLEAPQPLLMHLGMQVATQNTSKAAPPLGCQAAHMCTPAMMIGFYNVTVMILMQRINHRLVLQQ